MRTVPTVTVDGLGSELKNTSGELLVGYFGTGTLNITNGGTVTSARAIFLGYFDGSEGKVMVDNGTLENTSGNLNVGFYGTGTLDILGGGKVTSTSDIYLGCYDDSEGTVTVDGIGSKMENTLGNLYVGEDGKATLNISNSGKVASASDIFIGTNATGTGTVTVDGLGSELKSTSGELGIGGYGKGFLEITRGATVTSANLISLGYYDGSEGTVTVDGTGSTLQCTSGAGALYVGYEGKGTLNITNGGKVTSASTILLGGDSTGEGTVTVDGADSELKSTSGVLCVGAYGKGELDITNGGKVTSAGDIMLGIHATGEGTAMVGKNSFLIGNSNVYVGGDDTQAEGIGLLAGSGTITANSGAGNVVVYSTGTLSPGDADGQVLKIIGNVDMKSGSTLAITLAETDTSSLDVSGGVTIEAGAILDVTGHGRKNREYLIIDAGSLSGATTFSDDARFSLVSD